MVTRDGINIRDVEIILHDFDEVLKEARKVFGDIQGFSVTRRYEGDLLYVNTARGKYVLGYLSQSPRLPDDIAALIDGGQNA